ncbi:hypothetical protein [Fodinibius sp. AD559]|uniref:hypothetical protein n=1 Tax=Fodinibius sp. AD559 TaxID=3424179 RepID=UPI004046EDAB
MRIIISFVIIIALAGLLPIHTLHAQQSKQMLLFEIDGNQYKKCNYNNEGELESYEKFTVGSIEKDTNTYRLPVELYTFNAEGELQDSTKTLYTCQPDEQKVLLNVFPFTDYGKGSKIKVNLLDTNAFYPVAPEPGWKIESIDFEMNIDKGLVGFLGGKSKININNRRVVPNDTLRTEQYQINSEVDLGVYVMGIRMKEFGYRVIEIIDKNHGIIWQKFTSDDDNSYFVIRLI